MTLDTKIRAKGPVDARAVHDWANRELLRASNPVIDDSGLSIVNAPGQGFDAWLITTHNNGQPFEFHGLLSDGWYAEHPEDLEEERARFEAEPVGYVELSFDTAYAFRDEQGRGCSDLHALYIVRLAEYFAGLGVEMAWRNEFTHEWHDGTDGLEEFAQQGAEAKAWFHGVVLPALGARLANGADQ